VHHQQPAAVDGTVKGGLTSKIHALVDSNGLPVRLALSPCEAHDNRLAGNLLSRLKSGSMLLADRGYDADWIRELAIKKGAWATSRQRVIATVQFASALISTVLVTRSNVSFNRIKQCRRGRNALRQTCCELPCLRPACIHPAMACYALMSPRPSSSTRRYAVVTRPPCKLQQCGVSDFRYSTVR
jgi:transposase